MANKPRKPVAKAAAPAPKAQAAVAPKVTAAPKVTPVAAAPVVTPAAPKTSQGAAPQTTPLPQPTITNKPSPKIIEKDKFMTDANANVKAGIEKFVSTAHDTTANTLDKVAEVTKAQLHKNLAAVDELVAHAKANTQAGVEVAHAAVGGFETVSKAVASMLQKSFADLQASTKTLQSVKTPAELFEVQKTQLKAYTDNFVAEASQLTETMTKVVNQIVAPIQSRAAVVADTITKKVA